MSEAEVRWIPLLLQLASQDGANVEGRQVVQALQSFAVAPDGDGSMPLTRAAIYAGAAVWALQWCPYDKHEGKRVSYAHVQLQDTFAYAISYCRSFGLNA